MTIEEMVKDRANAEARVYAAYEKAQKLQPKLRDVISFVDPHAQLERLEEGGALYGVPIALKDNVSTKGILTTAGSRILSNYVPIYDATIVAKLREAGAVTIAKSSMDELAMGGTNKTCFTGPAYNPWDVRRITGGSSGGSAALVASGVVPLAIRFASRPAFAASSGSSRRMAVSVVMASFPMPLHSTMSAILPATWPMRVWRWKFWRGATSGI